MVSQSQSESMWGPQVARPAALPDNAGMIEYAAANGRVVTRSPNSELFIEHTPPVLLPAPPDMSARGQLAPRVAQAESLLAHAEAHHAMCVESLAEARRAMVTASASEPWVEQQLLAASTALTVAASRVEAFKSHRDAMLQQIAAWEASGVLDAYDDEHTKQSGVGLDKELAPLIKRATKLGGDFGAVVVAAQAVVAEIMSARQKASRLATTLGFTRHRDSGINAASAAIKISRAFAEGFRGAAPALDLKRWLAG